MTLGKIIFSVACAATILSCVQNGRQTDTKSGTDTKSETLVMVPAQIPDVKLITPDGGSVSLANIIDRTTYIDIWASWCGPCRGEIPHMEELVGHFKDNDKVRFISISVDESREDWAFCLADENPSWPQYIAADKEELEKLAAALQIEYIPRFVLADAEGYIIETNAPRPSSGEEIIALIEKEL